MLYSIIRWILGGEGKAGDYEQEKRMEDEEKELSQVYQYYGSNPEDLYHYRY